MGRHLSSILLTLAVVSVVAAGMAKTLGEMWADLGASEKAIRRRALARALLIVGLACFGTALFLSLPEPPK
jgi:type II secretory pathway component PulK